MDLGAYRQLDFVRPPLFTGLLALLLRLGAPAFRLPLLHGAVVLIAAALLPLTHALARALGAGRQGAFIAVALLLASPLFLAQAGLLQSDLPATALCALSWLLLLRGRTGLFALCGCLAVLCKESAWFLCLPAWVLLGRRSGFLRRAHLLPAAAPGLCLGLWLLLHRRLTGHAVAGVQRAFVTDAGYFGSALLHNFVEGGRLPLLAPALVLLHLRPTPERAATALLFALLPFCFPATLPRYMLPSLPFLCALAGAGLELLPGLGRLATSLSLGLLLLAGLRGDSWHTNGGHHLEQNLAYREALGLQRRAARALADARPHAVLATFPMLDALRAPPEDGYLPAPQPARAPDAGEPLVRLCQHDYLVTGEERDDAATQALRSALQQLRNRDAVTLWRQFGDEHGVGSRPGTPSWARTGQTIRIYRVRCE